MSYVNIQTHLDSYSGEIVNLKFATNNITDETILIDVDSRSEMISLLDQYDIDRNITLYVKNDSYISYWTGLGFNDVRSMDDVKVFKLFINDTDYLELSNKYASLPNITQNLFYIANIQHGISDVTFWVYNPDRFGTAVANYVSIVWYKIDTEKESMRLIIGVDSEASLINEWFEKSNAQPEDTDPYNKGGTSGTGGGTGTFSGTGDSIEFPGLPTLSAVSTGFITLFNPSIAQMQSLANYMWSDLFDLDTFKKIFADPMDCILGLSIVPVAVPNGGTAEVKVGNISTGVSMTVASTQYVEVDCGTLNVKEYWGSYLDYDPYTKAEIYLPYCGTHPIAVDDIMGKSVHVKYHVDILSGACVAYVKCGSSVLYSFIGQCTSSIPITGNDWTNVVNGAISIASAIGSMVATGGATAPLVLPGVASTAVNNLKPSVEKSGSMSGTGGMLAVQTPYLILTRPRQALPKNQNTYTGYPSFIKEKLSDLKGYTEVAEIRLSGVDATDAELDEIVGLLKGGVII